MRAKDDLGRRSSDQETKIILSNRRVRFLCSTRASAVDGSVNPPARSMYHAGAHCERLQGTWPPSPRYTQNGMLAPSLLVVPGASSPEPSIVPVSSAGIRTWRSMKHTGFVHTYPDTVSGDVYKTQSGRRSGFQCPD